MKEFYQRENDICLIQQFLRPFAANGQSIFPVAQNCRIFFNKCPYSDIKSFFLTE
jgi:hypothetical protein